MIIHMAGAEGKVTSLMVVLVNTYFWGSSVATMRCPYSLPRTPYLSVYKDSCYQFIKEEVYWDEAQRNCKGKGGNLVQIRDVKTQTWIVGMLQSLQWPHNGVWIGASDQDTEGQWKWVTGDEIRYNNWAPGQTSNVISKWTEDCAQLRFSDSGQWHDYPCHFGPYLYSSICQYGLVPETATTGVITTTTAVRTRPGQTSSYFPLIATRTTNINAHNSSENQTVNVPKHSPKTIDSTAYTPVINSTGSASIKSTFNQTPSTYFPFSSIKASVASSKIPSTTHRESSSSNVFSQPSPSESVATTLTQRTTSQTSWEASAAASNSDLFLSTEPNLFHSSSAATNKTSENASITETQSTTVRESAKPLSSAIETTPFTARVALTSQSPMLQNYSEGGASRQQQEEHLSKKKEFGKDAIIAVVVTVVAIIAFIAVVVAVVLRSRRSLSHTLGPVFYDNPGYSRDARLCFRDDINSTASLSDITIGQSSSHGEVEKMDVIQYYCNNDIYGIATNTNNSIDLNSSTI